MDPIRSYTEGRARRYDSVRRALQGPVWNGNRDLTTAGYLGNVGKHGSAKPYFPHTRHSLVFEREARQ
jgi:hypothetical protein